MEKITIWLYIHEKNYIKPKKFPLDVPHSDIIKNTGNIEYYCFLLYFHT